jgi:HK97 family phage prohead protease
MPYFITDSSPDCAAWAVIKDDGEVVACHDTKQSAVDQMVAISLAEDIPPGGERYVKVKLDKKKRDLPDNYRPATADDVPEGRACGNCIFFNEEKLRGDLAYCERWEDYVAGGYYCNAWEPKDEARDVNLTPPAYMRASARRGLAWHREGLSGDGLVERTVREAAAMAEGNVTADKWVRIAAWIARHLVDLDAPAAQPGNDNYPSAGVVAMALWGGGTTKRQANRALEYAQGVVDRIREEEQARGAIVTNLETRVFDETFEVREESDGMRLEGYAALFNSRSQNLGGFTETIAPGAFSRSLKSRGDVKLLWNHDSGEVLGSTRAKTLTLVEDERGLKVSALLPNTSRGRDAAELIKRGDVTGFSFGFSLPATGGDDWNAEGTERVLKTVKIHEVSLTPFPAYTATNGTATVRALDKVAERAQVDADELADALQKVEAGEEISIEEKSLISKVIDTLAPAPEPKAVDEAGIAFLQLKKKKLSLIEKGI